MTYKIGYVFPAPPSPRKSNHIVRFEPPRREDPLRDRPVNGPTLFLLPKIIPYGTEGMGIHRGLKIRDVS